jgi:hypothetical protein
MYVYVIPKLEQLSSNLFLFDGFHHVCYLYIRNDYTEAQKLHAYVKNLFFKIILVKKGLVVSDFDDMPAEQKKKKQKKKRFLQV